MIAQTSIDPNSSQAWMIRHRATVQAGRDLRTLAIQQIMSSRELESDEGGSAWDKAEAIYKREVSR